MGNCLGGGTPSQLLETTDGGEEAYHKRFLEDTVILGQGEFGIVKLVHDMSSSSLSQQSPDANGTATVTTANGSSTTNNSNHKPMACKILRKGVVFKDNTLYSPLKPEILRGEIQMLRALAGEHYCLRLHAVYETPRQLYMVTEYCAGGELTEYVASLAAGEVASGAFSTADVSRIAHQLLSAVAHCHRHRILHRDIKPENILFTDPTPGADIRLIDFGSGTMDDNDNDHRSSGRKNKNHTAGGDDNNSTNEIQRINGWKVHHTFAGSAFYISPEMFQRKYTALTDVWSVGASLYVLVAGYPADALQQAFNILQTNGKNRNLRSLPNLPPNLPDSFYNLLEGCLTYRHKNRPSAETLLNHEFVTFHLGRNNRVDNDNNTVVVPELSLEAISAAARGDYHRTNNSNSGSATRILPPAASVSLAGSVVRHHLFMGFKTFERAVTTLLAALLSKAELERLLTLLEAKIDATASTSTATPPTVLTSTTTTTDSTTTTADQKSSPPPPQEQQQQQLAVVRVSELKAILRNDLKNRAVYVFGFQPSS